MNVLIPIARPEMGRPEWEAVREVIESGWVTQGPRVQAFERAVAEFCGAEHGVAVSSCTTALHLALVCAGVGAGDEVVVPSMSFIATANAVVHAGAVPVFAEVDPATFNLALDDVRGRVTPRTKAIVLVHQLGVPADIDSFSAFSREQGLMLIEDAACAIGSRYHDAPIGSHSDLVCFSFHPRKLVTTGDGGMVLTSRQDYADRLRLLRQHGMSVSDQARHSSSQVIRERYVEVAYNYRLTDIQAAVGIEQLRRLPKMLEQRQELARRYDDALRDHPVIDPPPPMEGLVWNVQSYYVRLNGFDASGRDAVMQHMLDLGVASRPGVMTAHREPAYAGVGARLPISEAASDTSIVLPLFPSMQVAEVEQSAQALIEAVERVRGEL